MCNEVPNGEITQNNSPETETLLREGRLPDLARNNSKSAIEAATQRRDEESFHKSAKHPTTYAETLIHYIKANTGAGMFAMGDAIKNSGLVLGPSLIAV
ncbi:proton-coupled amino acid transporter 3-like, partial [Frankliniella occidentalis]|uniref:Proton-coupled amino acid transporter 3-like n=1 Tax=Frankliniella occidentalis TaxID=133901 RepID=A0A9C6XAG5_FRAOC